MLAAKRLGMPDIAIMAHAGVLWALQYSVKTMFGISDGYYKSHENKVLFGTGQGSGASPAAWLTVSIVLLSCLKKLVSRGMRFTTPDNLFSVERHLGRMPLWMTPKTVSTMPIWPYHGLSPS